MYSIEMNMDKSLDKRKNTFKDNIIDYLQH